MSIQNIAPYLNGAGSRVRVRRTQKEQGNVRHDGTTRTTGELRPFEPQNIKRILTARYYLGIFTRGEGRLSK